MKELYDEIGPESFNERIIILQYNIINILTDSKESPHIETIALFTLLENCFRKTRDKEQLNFTIRKLRILMGEI